ncbi:hypothetical protein G7050_12925 [Dysgonomonas sp. HDW5A]|uniref:hypothetical protein n=1 Tax=Dysgonomonas sp. HDW5A TaxID=2714926 RepID=UPI00140B7D4F|nr:hypothetical protein [Dysgonomonas sp. HDW5A]QIK60685.1 hypothetical protein G7050_12925 [Dysgonomonas sp. HDW5A]
MDKLGFICVIGAVIRLLFYKILRKKDITIKHLTGRKDDQQMTSLGFGFAVIFLFAFIITKLL